MCFVVLLSTVINEGSYVMKVCLSYGLDNDTKVYIFIERGASNEEKGN